MTEGAGPVPGSGAGEPSETLPLLPGFREMALRRMAAQRRRLVMDLAAERRAARMSQTEVAACMGTSQSAVARLESGEADARASTLERYAAAIGHQITWQLRAPAAGQAPAGGSGGVVPPRQAPVPSRREEASADGSAR
jgi:predicted XRE-type DNA-binding protein